MTKTKRIKEFLLGIVMLIFAGIISVFPEEGADLVVGIVSVSLLIYGIKLLVYYLTMAKNMNGGETVLYRSILILDLGIFAVALATIPRSYIMLYLLGYEVFLGVVDVLRALEMKKVTGTGWKLEFVFGLYITVASLSGLFHMGSTEYFVGIYTSTLVLSAISRIIGAFRKTAVVYIQ